MNIFRRIRWSCCYQVIANLIWKSSAEYSQANKWRCAGTNEIQILPKMKMSSFLRSHEKHSPNGLECCESIMKCVRSHRNEKGSGAAKNSPIKEHIYQSWHVSKQRFLCPKYFKQKHIWFTKQPGRCGGRRTAHAADGAMCTLPSIVITAAKWHGNRWPKTPIQWPGQRRSEAPPRAPHRGSVLCKSNTRLLRPIWHRGRFWGSLLFYWRGTVKK